LLDPKLEAKLNGDAVLVAVVEAGVLKEPATNEKAGTALDGSPTGLEAGKAPKAKGRDGSAVDPVVSDLVVVATPEYTK
jgi:hypothetical protein